MGTDTRDLTGARASSLAMCERKVIFEALGAPRAETPPYLERIFARGRRLGMMIAQEMAEDLDAQGRSFVVEKEVSWGTPTEVLGTGHADLFIPDEALTVEVVSTKDAALPPNKPRQVSIYSHFDPESEAATVLSIDPGTNDQRVYPIDVDAFVPWIEDAIGRVAHGMKNHKPDSGRRALRPDGTQVDNPTENVCASCPFARMCWADYQPVPVGDLPEELGPIVLELADLEDQLGAMKRAAHLEERRSELREQIRGRMKPGTNYRSPGLSKVRYSEVAGRRTFSLADFEAAGHTLPPEAEAFVKTGRGHDRWTIQRENN